MIPPMNAEMTPDLSPSRMSERFMPIRVREERPEHYAL